VIARFARLGLILAALVAAWLLSPRASRAPGAASGHQHGGTAAADSVRPVMLSDDDQHRIGVTFAAVEKAPLQRSVRIVAQVSYDETRVFTIAPRFEGWADRLFADYVGQQVRAGDRLLSVYAPMVTAAAAELLVAKRLASTVSSAGSDAPEHATALVASARERLVVMGLSDGEIRQIEETAAAPTFITVRAPRSGVVVEKRILAGQRIMEGDPLYRIADLSVVWLEGDVFEQDLGAARVGQQVAAEFQALPGEVRTGRITFVAPALSLETRTGRVRVALPNPGLVLKPGMFATIRFTTPATRAVLSVPRSAVLSTGERNLVFLKRRDGRFTPTDVTVGVQTEDRLQILRGLSAGDTVVASATFLVDAESNLGTLLGGMGDMPGMDITAPGADPDAAPPTAPHDTIGNRRGMDMPGMDMPGMDMPKPEASDSPAGHNHTGHLE
jgi:Cu(I)/Ag(I) efflux system membrane fusion protein